MYAKHLEEFIIREDENIYKANWMLCKNNFMLIVIDGNEKFMGIITKGDMSGFYYSEESGLTAKDICNRNCKFVRFGDNLYSDARNIFADYNVILSLPVLDDENNIVDIFTRERAFYQKYLAEKRLPRMHYASCIYVSAFEAKRLGLSKISVIEFGVAGGNGLVNCEFHAREISRLLGIEIEVYGFDNASGLPMENAGYKDSIHLWKQGYFCMKRDVLEKRLQFAKLVIGDVSETTLSFFNDYNPAPIGAVLIDVDYYSSAVPILKMLEEDDKYFLPRVQMYFDDIVPKYDTVGENLAIKEFNSRNEYLKISPEGFSDNFDVIHGMQVANYTSGDIFLSIRMKQLNRFKHPLYNKHLQVSNNDMCQYRSFI